MSNKKPTVVVVDDNEIVLEKVRTVLESAGYKVITRTRAIGCVALTLQEEPALVLLDVGMPGVGGDTLVRLLMTAVPNRRTVVLLYSGMRERDLRRVTEQSGADGYICKSSDYDELLREVAQWLGPVSPPLTNRDSHQPLGSVGTGPLSAKTPHILFIDDDMQMLSAYRRLIQSERMNVEFALSGTQGLRWILSADPPDVVVCDLMMAPPSGEEVYAKALLSDRSWRERFVVVSGMGDAKQRLGWEFTGPILRKPVDNGELLAAIRSCLVRTSPSAQFQVG